MKQGRQIHLNRIREMALSIVSLIDNFQPYSENLDLDLLEYIEGDIDKIMANIKDLRA